MAREQIDISIDLGNPENKRRVMSFIGTARGLYNVSITPTRSLRSLQANRYYHGVVVKCFADFLRDQGEGASNDDCHEMLKFKFLRRSIVDKATGEVIEFTPSTAKLDKAEFSRYVDLCAAWLKDFFGILLPAPDYAEQPIPATPNRPEDF